MPGPVGIRATQSGVRDCPPWTRCYSPFHTEYNIPGSLSGLTGQAHHGVKSQSVVTMATLLVKATTPAVSSSGLCRHQIPEASGVSSGDTYEELRPGGLGLCSHRPWHPLPGQMTTQEASRTTFRGRKWAGHATCEGVASPQPTTPNEPPTVAIAAGLSLPYQLTGCPTAGVPRPLQASGPQRP